MNDLDEALKTYARGDRAVGAAHEHQAGFDTASIMVAGVDAVR